MNGRCTADPLDHADDICDFCGDEFCSSCLIATRKGKGPLVCRECAINNSGIKGSRPTKARATKAQINKARATLAESKDTRSAKSFHFFDEEDGYVSPEVEIAEQDESESDEARNGQSSKRRFSLRRKHDDAAISIDDDEVTEPGELSDPVDEAPIPEPIAEPTPTPTPIDQAPSRPSTPATALIESGGLARLSTGEPACPTEAVPLEDAAGLGDAPATVARTTTPSLADRLRTPAAPPMSTPAPASTSFHDDARAFMPPVTPAVDLPAPADPTPATVTRRVSDPAPAPQPSAMDLDSDPFASPDYDLQVAVPPADVAAPPTDLSFPGSTGHAGTGSSFEWQQASAPVNEDLSDDPFGTSPLPAPAVEPARIEPVSAETAHIGVETAGVGADTAQVETAQVDTAQVETAQARPEVAEAPEPERAAWQPADAVDMPAPGAFPSPTIAPARPSAATPRPAPVPASQPTVAQPTAEQHLTHAASPSAVAVSDEPSAASADTDSNGNWIPPVLRGMAPVVERRADPLPRRRQHD